LQGTAGSKRDNAPEVSFRGVSTATGAALVEQARDHGGDQAARDGGENHVIAAAHVVIALRRTGEAIAAVVADHVALGPIGRGHALTIGPAAHLVAARRVVARGAVAALGLLPAGVGALLLTGLLAVVATLLAPLATVVP